MEVQDREGAIDMTALQDQKLCPRQTARLLDKEAGD